MSNCIFCKIINKEIPAKIVFENENIIAFNDISPKAPVHVLIVPKKHIATLNDITTEDQTLIGEMYIVAKEIAKNMEIAEPGYRVIANCNEDGGQEVFHIHFHLLGGKNLNGLLAD